MERVAKVDSLQEIIAEMTDNDGPAKIRSQTSQSRWQISRMMARSCWKRVRRQSAATWREHHWIGNPRPGAKRKTIGASEGDGS
jgi:hypothetical protein